MLTSPFARFDLFRNPFGELTVEQRAEQAVVDSAKYLNWLAESPRAALQVIGPCGHGKSTHLRALQYAWPRHTSSELPAFVYFPEEGDQPALPLSRPLFIDEAQRMGWRRRRQMLRGAGPLVIGTHRDLSQELTNANFQLFTIDLHQSMPPERLQEILNRRIMASRRSSGSSTTESDDHSLMLNRNQVVALQQRFGSNIRQIEDFLYEQFQNCALKGEPWLPAN